MQLRSFGAGASVTLAPPWLTKTRTTAYQLPFTAVCGASIAKITLSGLGCPIEEFPAGAPLSSREY